MLRQLQLGGVLMLMLASSGAEIFSLGALRPFQAVLANREIVWNMAYVQQLAPLLGMSSAAQLLLPVTVLFVRAPITAAAVPLLNVWVNGRLVASIGSDLTCKVYRRTLLQPY